MTFPDEVFDRLPVNGWLTRDEARLLWDTASATGGPILEVGCYYGRSTCLLAALGRPVYTVDPFAGFDSDDPNGSEVCVGFIRNVMDRGYLLTEIPPSCQLGLRGAGLHGVILFHGRIEDWTLHPVGFAYLDGDHTYRGTLAQIDRALLCRPQAVAAHDVNDSGGGAQVKRACLERLGPWSKRVERLAVWWPKPPEVATT